MDAQRFDALTRSFVGRRAALGGLLAVLLPGVGFAKPGGAGGGSGRGRGDGERGGRGDGRGTGDRDGRKDRSAWATGGAERPAGGPAAERCLANGQRCGKGSGKRGKEDIPSARCCSQYVTPRGNGPRRCSCAPEGAACANPSQCCGGRCTGGRCGPCQPGLTLCPVDGCVDIQSDPRDCGSCANACAAGQACEGGVCTCSGTSCAGCCDGSQCRSGDADDACGINGGACQACAGTGVTCGGGGAPGVCGCTPAPDAVTCAGRCGTVTNNCGQQVNCTTRCAGCCAGGTCRAGTADDACGRGGVACQPCSGLGVTCGGGGEPRVCGCTPDCAGKGCGGDGCGGSCGTCSGAFTACDGNGVCVCSEGVPCGGFCVPSDCGPGGSLEGCECDCFNGATCIPGAVCTTAAERCVGQPGWLFCEESNDAFPRFVPPCPSGQTLNTETCLCELPD